MGRFWLIFGALVWLLPLQGQEPAKAAEKKTETAADGSKPENLLGRVNAAGGEARRNENIFITAINNNAQRESGIRVGMTATPVTELKAESRYYGAELGVSPTGSIHLGAQRIGNGLHGGVYWTHSNSAFTARSFFQVGGVRPARENAWGARVSIPLWTGSFLGLEGSHETRSGFVNGNVLVPLANERTCLSPDPQICAVVNRYFAAWPNVAPNRPDIEQRTLNTNAPQSILTQTASPRWEQVWGRHRVTARHAWTGQQVDAFQLVAGQNPDTTTRSHDARLTWTYTAGPRTNFDVSTGFQRATSLLAPEPNAVGPQVVIGTAFERLGPISSVPLDRMQNRYRGAFRGQHIAGKHTLSAGFEYGRLQFNGREASANRGNIFFRNDFGRDAITNFRLGVPNRYSFGAGEMMRGFRRHEWAFFAQDTYRVTNSFVLNLTLRWQPQLPLNEVDGLNDIAFNCDCNNVGPGVGFAWRLPRGWGLMRAGYSIQFGEILPATLTQVRWNPPGFQKVENQRPPLLNLLEGVVLDPNARATVFEYPRNLATPYSQQYTLMWQPPLSGRYGSLELAYVGSRTWKLLYLQYLNRARNLPGLESTTANINLRRPSEDYFDYRYIFNLPRAYYDAGKVTYTLPTRGGWTVNGSYWFSKAIDTGATFVNIAAGEDAMQGHAQVENGVIQDLKGVSNFHQAHAALATVSYQVPRQVKWLQDWRVSAVAVGRSGTPFTLTTGSDAPGYGNVDGVTGDRPHLLDPRVLGKTMSHPDVAPQLLPASAFAFLRPGDERGNIGVNTFRRAPLRNLNLAVERRFLLGRDKSLAFRAESINATNTPQFAEPVADLSNPAFGKITNTLNDGRNVRFTLSVDF